MDTFFLFLSDIAHQILFWVGGALATVVFIIEKVREKSVAKKWFVWTALACMCWSIFQAWVDEHRNTQTVIAEKASSVAADNACRSDLRVTEATLQGLRSFNDSLRSTVDNQQTANTKQQLSINSCMISLGKLNPRLDTHASVLYFPVVEQKVPYGRYRFVSSRYLFAVVITTNRIASPVGRFKCDKAFSIDDNPQLPTLENRGLPPIYIAQQQPTPVSDREYRVRISSPNLDWGPNSPIYFVATSDYDTLGNCTFAIQ